MKCGFFVRLGIILLGAAGGFLAVFFGWWFYYLIALRGVGLVAVVLELRFGLSNLQRGSWVALLLLFPAVFVPLRIAFYRRSAKCAVDCAIPDGAVTRFLDCGNKALDSLISAVECAKRSVYLEFYIVSRGVVFDRLCAALVRACARGVAVELIYGNRLLSRPISARSKRLLRSVGAVVRASDLGGLNAWFLGFNNHRKLAVVDDVWYVGGVNIADEYANLPENGAPRGFFKDSLLRVEQGVEMFCCSPEGGEAKARVLNEIGLATTALTICTPYLVPDSDVVRALTDAVKRGVRVTIAIPLMPDKPLAHKLGLYYGAKLARLGVNVVQYQKGYLHLKAILSCGEKTRCMVGSINLDMRSMYQQYECGALLYSREVEQAVQNVLADCAPIKKRRTLLLPLLLLFAPII